MKWQEMLPQINMRLAATMAPNTAIAYQHAISAFGFSDKPDIDTIVEKTILWRNTGTSNATILQRFAAVKWIFKHFPREFDPIDILEIRVTMEGVKKDEREMVFATQEETEKIILLSSARDALVVGMAYYAGMRIGEIANCKLSHWQVDKTTGALSILIPTTAVNRTKNQKDRRIPVLPRLEQLFHAYVKGERSDRIRGMSKKPDALILTRKGTPTGVCCRVLQLNVFDACKTAGFPHLHAHSFRHGLATTLARETGNIKLIKEVLGHKSISSTMKYIHMTQQEIADNMQAAFD